MPITTGSFAKFLWPGVKTAWGQEYNKYPNEWKQIYQVVPSTRAWEEEVGFSGFGLALKKTEGGKVQYDTAKQGFKKEYRHEVYALGFVITEELYEDGLAGTESIKRAQSLAFSMNQTQETLGANVLNRAVTSGYTGADGKTLLATDHPNLKDGSTWSNKLSTAADLSESALESAVIGIGGFETDSGLKIKISAKRLIIPIDLQFEATRILKSAGRVDTANNDTNALRTMGAIPEIVVNHFLTDTDQWFVQTDCPHGLKYMERRKMRFKNDSDFDTENMKCKADFRGIHGWTDPRCVYGSEGAA